MSYAFALMRFARSCFHACNTSAGLPASVCQQSQVSHHLPRPMPQVGRVPHDSQTGEQDGDPNTSGGGVCSVFIIFFRPSGGMSQCSPCAMRRLPSRRAHGLLARRKQTQGGLNGGPAPKNTAFRRAFHKSPPTQKHRRYPDPTAIARANKGAAGNPPAEFLQWVVWWSFWVLGLVIAGGCLRLVVRLLDFSV